MSQEEHDNMTELIPPKPSNADHAITTETTQVAHELTHKSTGMSISWSNLCLTVRNKKSSKQNNSNKEASEQEEGEHEEKEKQILHNVSGEAKPGEFLAILGPSGAGKSSLLNVLSLRTQRGASGVIRINDMDPKLFSNKFGYVKQETLFFESLTVRETLKFAADLRMDRKTSKDEKAKRIDALLDQMDLKKCADTYIGTIGSGISGGERKRLTVAMELINEPDLIFCDEPTSGLDSATALNLISTLSKLTKEHNRTIICTIHQPRASILPFFDKILLMAEGKTMYFGRSFPHATKYFEDAGFPCPQFENPADFMLDLVNTREVVEQKSNLDRHEVVEKLSNFYTSSSYNFQPNSQPDAQVQVLDSEQNDGHCCGGRSNYPNPGWYQMMVVLKRSFWHKVREPSAAATQVMFATILPLIIGSVFWQLDFAQNQLSDIVSAISFAVTVFTMISFEIVILFPAERKLYLEEHFAGLYSTGAYYWGRSLAELPFHVIFTLIGATIMYWMFGLNDNVGDFVVYLVFLVLATIAASSWYLFASSLSRNMEEANSIVTLLILLLLLFNGFYVNTNNIPDWYIWLEVLSFYKYPTEAIAYTQFKGQTLICPPAPEVCTFPTGDDYLVYLGFNNVNVAWNAGILVIMIVVLRILAYLGLKFLHNGKTFKEALKH